MATYDRRALPFSAEDLALTALVRILPRTRYRLAAQSDARFQSFASNTIRIAYRQQGSTPSFLLFSGTGQNPHAAAMAAATWAETNWRPNAIQRRVRPGVVAVHVAPGNQLTPAGPITGAAVPTTVWTVDSATGGVESAGRPPGSPSASDIKASASSLMRGAPAPTLGELDLAEKGVMQLRSVAMPRWLTGAAGLILLYLALRFGVGGLAGLLVLPFLLTSSAASQPYAVVALGANAIMLAGIVFGAALLFNFRNLAFRTPGFGSPVESRRNLAWGAYIAGLIGLAIALQTVIPSMSQPSAVNAGHASYAHAAATVQDDGGETYVSRGGVLTVDLTGWPDREWNGVTFKSSNPSVLSLDSTQNGKPVATFTANQTGVARVGASSADATYTFQLRVDVGTA